MSILNLSCFNRTGSLPFTIYIGVYSWGGDDASFQLVATTINTFLARPIADLGAQAYATTLSSTFCVNKIFSTISLFLSQMAPSSFSVVQTSMPSSAIAAFTLPGKAVSVMVRVHSMYMTIFHFINVDSRYKPSATILHKSSPPSLHRVLLLPFFIFLS